MLANLKCYDLNPPKRSYFNEVLSGLTARRKKLPYSLLYDEQGSKLFEEICEQEEYYVTRTELDILRKYAPDIAKYLGHAPFIFEFGSGNNQKIRPLLEHVQGQCSYMAVDISKEHLYKNAEALARDFPHVQVFAVCADFNTAPPFPAELKTELKKIFFFPGSTIGNLCPKSARQLLGQIWEIVGKEGAALVGVDLKKDPELLRRAYNDASGITSRFELNILKRINEELHADFDLSAFRYLGTYNQRLGKMEMYLVSEKNQVVHLGTHKITFHRGETIHVEDSYKYSIDEFHSLASSAGFGTTMTWLDKRSWFSMNLLLP